MRFWIATLISVLALGGAACGDDDDGSAAADKDMTPPRATTAPDGDGTDVKASDRPGVNVTGQETLIEVSTAFDEALEGDGVKLEALDPARMNGQTIVLPIDGGRVSVEDGGGTVDHSGTIAFRGDTRSVEIDDLFVDTRSGTVYGLVTGSRVRVFNLDTSKLDVQKGEDHLVAGDLKVQLAEDGAAVLNEELDASLKAGQDVGTMKVRLVPRLPGAAGAPDAPGQVEEPGADTLAELRSLEERARALAERAGKDLAPETQERVQEAMRELERALAGE